MTTGAGDISPDHEALRSGELILVGRIRSASNATFLCEARTGDHSVHCVYKPVAGEQPLWDFPDGTLADRERSAYLVSAALGWNVVPHTIIRDGPAGRGMVQLWIDEVEGHDGTELVDLCAVDSVPSGYLPVLRAHDDRGNEVALVHADDIRLRRVAVFDVIINNADRKGGHILTAIDGRVYGVDHGVSLHVEDKLRTVLWGWAGKPVDDAVMESVAELDRVLAGRLSKELSEHLTAHEITALQTRVSDLLRDPVMPMPDGRRPIPWPAF